MTDSIVQRGFSDAAKFLDETNKAVVLRLQETATFTKQSAYDQLGEVWEDCRHPNWDDEGADPISQDTLRSTYIFIESLPPGCPLPEITGEPDGHINLEWYQHTRRILSVSVSPEGTLYWAALFGTEDPRGSCQFYGDIPETILNWIWRVSGE